MDKSIKSCVMKKTWQNYKTCFECGLRRKCASEHKPNLFGQIYEAIVVYIYRKKIALKTKKLIKGYSRSDIKNAKRNFRSERKSKKI